MSRRYFSEAHPDRDDEEGRNIGAENRALMWESNEQLSQLRAVSDRVARAYWYDSTENVRAHFGLCLRLRALSSEASEPTLGERPLVPRDLPTPASARERLQRCAQLIDEAGAALAELSNTLFNDVVENPTARAALHEAGWSERDTDEGFDLVWSLPDTFHGGSIRELRDMLADAASALPAVKPRRLHPDWHARAAALCAAWWREREGGEPEVKFKRTAGDDANPKTGKTRLEWQSGSLFTDWFCDLMQSLFGLGAATCKTALQKANIAPRA